MKKLCLMICVIGLIGVLIGIGPAVCSNANAEVDNCSEIAIDVRSGLSLVGGLGKRVPRIREGSMSLVTVIVYSDPNDPEKTFAPGMIDPNDVMVIVGNRDAVYPKPIGDLTFDLNRDEEPDRVLFYTARELLPADDAADAEDQAGETELVMYCYEDENCYMGTDTIVVLKQFKFRGFGFLDLFQGWSYR